MSDPPKNARLFLRVIGGLAIFQSALVIAKHNRIIEIIVAEAAIYSIVNSILLKWTMEFSISDGRDTTTAIRIVDVLKLNQLRAVKSCQRSNVSRRWSTRSKHGRLTRQTKFLGGPVACIIDQEG